MSARSAARFSELHPQEPSSSRDFGFVTFTGARARSTGTATHFTNVSHANRSSLRRLSVEDRAAPVSLLFSLTQLFVPPVRLPPVTPGPPFCACNCWDTRSPHPSGVSSTPPLSLARAGHPCVRVTPPRAVLRRLGLGRRTVVVGRLDHLRVWLEDGLARLLFGDEEDDGEQKEGADDGANHDARNLAAGEAVVRRRRRRRRRR
mmetsp:Transcript_7464/g.24865  ORF Transcript_7464/g.24865 Transcript_7464/m.24865 type:complete len:204 (+) Transcript_7464:75-686(+)